MRLVKLPCSMIWKIAIPESRGLLLIWGGVMLGAPRRDHCHRFAASSVSNSCPRSWVVASVLIRHAGVAALGGNASSMELVRWSNSLTVRRI